MTQNNFCELVLETGISLWIFFFQIFLLAFWVFKINVEMWKIVENREWKIKVSFKKYLRTQNQVENIPSSQTDICSTKAWEKCYWKFIWNTIVKNIGEPFLKRSYMFCLKMQFPCLFTLVVSEALIICAEKCILDSSRCK